MWIEKKAMMTGIHFRFKIIRRMVKHNKFKNFLKIVKKRCTYAGFITSLINTRIHDC